MANPGGAPSPEMKCSTRRELKDDNYKREHSLKGGILIREKDEDLALFNDLQSIEADNYLLQSDDDFEDACGETNSWFFFFFLTS